MQSLLETHSRPYADLHSFRHTFNQNLLELRMEIEDRQKLLAHAYTTATKIYSHLNFELAMQYINQVTFYGKECNQLKMIKRKQTKLNVKQKSPHLRGPLVEILVFSVVAGEGFEPPTFGL